MRSFRNYAVILSACALLAACSEEDKKVGVSVCGNGIVEEGEQCDDGNTADGDGCSSTCQNEEGPAAPVCGNGIVEDGEECDDGNTEDGDGCSSACQNEEGPAAPVCGNGIVEDGEECDDGNTENGDGCSSTCQNEEGPAAPVCGNGIVEEGEECDDGNTADGDGCSSTCQNEAPVETCGNGIIDEHETCDDGNTEDGDGCSSECLKEGPVFFMPNPGPETKCNDGKHEAGEVCDPAFSYILNFDGITRSCLVQDGQCVIATVPTGSNCGTGTLEPGEECDDGNTVNGDGCDSRCRIEPDTRCFLRNGSWARVILVTDGDSFRIDLMNDGNCTVTQQLSIRLHGIDSPECLKKSTPSPIRPGYSANACDPDQAENFSDLTRNERGGYAAAQVASAIIYSEENNGYIHVECETRGPADDRCLTDATNNRYLIYAKLKKDGQYIDLGAELVRQGYAFAYTDFTSQHIARYCAAEHAARNAKVGVWSYADTFEDVVMQYFSGYKQGWLLLDGKHAEICGE